jgi:hypothetical protein
MYHGSDNLYHPCLRLAWLSSSLYAQYFRNRGDPYSTSVGGNTRSCEAVSKTNKALLLLINVCATMVLGMSNTYQQLVTSLTVTDLKYVFEVWGFKSRDKLAV